MAACYLDDEQLQLSSVAIEMLKEIESIKVKSVTKETNNDGKQPENGTKDEVKKTIDESKRAEIKDNEIEIEQACEKFFMYLVHMLIKEFTSMGVFLYLKFILQNTKMLIVKILNFYKEKQLSLLQTVFGYLKK